MTDTAEKSWVPLKARERRVIGVLVEKGQTTPEYYPMTVAAIVTGCNQKSNRDPVTNYDADDVEEILDGLRKKGAAILVEAGGRVVRWRHTMYEWLKVSRPELAVIAELLLRGPQTEGDLRGRASRMSPLTDLPALQAVLESLGTKQLVLTLSPPGVRRGVVVTHNLYPPDELERERARFATGAFATTEEDRSPRPSRAEAAPGVTAEEMATLRADLDALRESYQTLAEEFRDLKSSLGA